MVGQTDQEQQLLLPVCPPVHYPWKWGLEEGSENEHAEWSKILSDYLEAILSAKEVQTTAR